jgi:hypothetical protein
VRTLLIACVLALGCGNDDVHHLNDGGGDAAPPIDAPAIDAAPAPGVVTVTVTGGGVGIAGVVVYFQNVDSSLVAEVMTDGSGVASATMKPGGYATVIQPGEVGSLRAAQRGAHPLGSAAPIAQDQLIFTWAGVKPGDNLLDDLDPPSSVPPDVDTFDITVPTDPNGSAAQYFLFTTCAGIDQVNITPPVTAPPLRRVRPDAVATNAPVNITISGCSGSADMLVQSRDVNSVPLDTFVVTGVPVANGSDVTLTGTYSAQVAVPLSLVNVPPEFDGANGGQTFADARGFLFESNNVSFDVSTGSDTELLPVPAFGSGITAATTIQLDSQGASADEQTLVSFGPVASSFQLDIGATRLANWVTQPQVDPIDEVLGWAIAKAGTRPDFLMSEVGTSRQNATPTADSWDWVVFAPGDQDGAITYPTLPTDVFDFAFRDTDDTGLFFMAGARAPGGYDAARDTILLTTFEYLDEPFLLAPAAGTGSIDVQAIAPRVGVRARATRPLPLRRTWSRR